MYGIGWRQISVAKIWTSLDGKTWLNNSFVQHQVVKQKFNNDIYIVDATDGKLTVGNDKYEHY